MQTRIRPSFTRHVVHVCTCKWDISHGGKYFSRPCRDAHVFSDVSFTEDSKGRALIHHLCWRQINSTTQYKGSNRLYRTNFMKTSIPTLVYLIIYTRPCWHLFTTSYQFSFWILRNYNKYYYFFRASCLLGGGGPLVGQVTSLGGVKKNNPPLHAILQPRHPGVHFLKIIEWSLST